MTAKEKAALAAMKPALEKMRDDAHKIYQRHEGHEKLQNHADLIYWVYLNLEVVMDSIDNAIEFDDL